MEKLIKAFFIIIMLLGLVGLLAHNQQIRSRAYCVQMQKMIMEREKLGLKVEALMVRPQCNFDGGFLAQQCDFNTQTCWCVDALGRPLSGTQTPRAKGQPSVCRLNWLGQAFLTWQLRAKRDGFVSVSSKLKTATQ